MNIIKAKYRNLHNIYPLTINYSIVTFSGDVGRLAHFLTIPEQQDTYTHTHPCMHAHSHRHTHAHSPLPTYTYNYKIRSIEKYYSFKYQLLFHQVNRQSTVVARNI